MKRDTRVAPATRDIYEMCETCVLRVNGNWPSSSAVSRARWRLSFDRRWPSSSCRPCRPTRDTCAVHAASRHLKREDEAHARSTRPHSLRSSRWSHWSRWSRWSRRRPRNRTLGRPKHPLISLTRRHPNRGCTETATWIMNRSIPIGITEECVKNKQSSSFTALTKVSLLLVEIIFSSNLHTYSNTYFLNGLL